MEVLQARCRAAKLEASAAYTKYAEVKKIYDQAEREWVSAQKEFEQLDYQLALIDGRRTILPPQVSGKKVAKQPMLTLEQIKEIAKKLGIQVSVDEVDEDADLVIEEGGDEDDDMLSV